MVEGPRHEGGNIRGWGAESEKESPMAIRLVLFSIALAMAGTAFAHDHSRPELDAWYATLQNANGVSCCDSGDATRIQDADWQSKCTDNECHYQVFIDGQWWDVPDWAIVKGPNKNGMTLVWPIFYFNDGKPENGISSIFIRCFMPGAGG
jgi:hypothetical protein